MHPVHLEILVAERRRELRDEADRHRLVRHGRGAAPIRSHVHPLAAFAAAFGSLVRRSRKKLRSRGTGAPLDQWHRREPSRGY
jgi:hypothetical protein